MPPLPPPPPPRRSPCHLLTRMHPLFVPNLYLKNRFFSGSIAFLLLHLLLPITLLTRFFPQHALLLLLPQHASSAMALHNGIRASQWNPRFPMESALRKGLRASQWNPRFSMESALHNKISAPLNAPHVNGKKIEINFLVPSVQDARVKCSVNCIQLCGKRLTKRLIW